LLKKLEEVVRTNGKSLTRGEVNDKMIDDEARYLSVLAFNIRSESKYFTMGEIVQELNTYYRKIGETVERLSNTLDVGLVGIPFIGGVADVICACENYAVQRASKVIQRNESNFRWYLDWLSDPSGSWLNLDAEKTEQLMDKSREMSNTDKKILALSLVLADEMPTILFTGDVNHLGYFARTIYFDPDSWLFSEPSKFPKHQFRVYAGFEKGWKLWVDSSQSPLVSK